MPVRWMRWASLPCAVSRVTVPGWLSVQLDALGPERAKPVVPMPLSAAVPVSMVGSRPQA